MKMPPSDFVQELRMREACRLLVEETTAIRLIAAEVGFADEYYFSRRFRHLVGQSPRQYRNTYRRRR